MKTKVHSAIAIALVSLTLAALTLTSASAQLPLQKKGAQPSSSNPESTPEILKPALTNPLNASSSGAGRGGDFTTLPDDNTPVLADEWIKSSRTSEPLPKNVKEELKRVGTIFDQYVGKEGSDFIANQISGFVRYKFIPQVDLEKMVIEGKCKRVELREDTPGKPFIGGCSKNLTTWIAEEVVQNPNFPVRTYARFIVHERLVGTFPDLEMDYVGFVTSGLEVALRLMRGEFFSESERQCNKSVGNSRFSLCS